MNHYQTLQVTSQASQQEIKQAYRRLAKQFHPDSGVVANNCDRIIALNAAYEVLGDTQSRRIYDRQIQLGCNDTSFVTRQTRTAQAQQQYRRHRQAEKARWVDDTQWLQRVYSPISHLIEEILFPLEMEIEDLAADPFDDELMENFGLYLENCSKYLNLAKQKLSSQPNPPELAGIAANIYYCLDRLEDGIKELELFTLNYNDRYLHMGREIFSIASKLRDRAQEEASIVS